MWSAQAEAEAADAARAVEGRGRHGQPDGLLADLHLQPAAFIAVRALCGDLLEISIHWSSMGALHAPTPLQSLDTESDHTTFYRSRVKDKEAKPGRFCICTVAYIYENEWILTKRVRTKAVVPRNVRPSAQATPLPVGREYSSLRRCILGLEKLA